MQRHTACRRLGGRQCSGDGGGVCGRCPNGQPCCSIWRLRDGSLQSRDASARSGCGGGGSWNGHRNPCTGHTSCAWRLNSGHLGDRRPWNDGCFEKRSKQRHFCTATGDNVSGSSACRAALLLLSHQLRQQRPRCEWQCFGSSGQCSCNTTAALAALSSVASHAKPHNAKASLLCSREEALRAARTAAAAAGALCDMSASLQGRAVLVEQSAVVVPPVVAALVAAVNTHGMNQVWHMMQESCSPCA